ncbi:MAG TPA: acyltransferase, partial [Gemmatimonadaceae bacterium]|nr:acyltransferase [Gemmatimonadaceae bacterium]
MSVGSVPFREVIVRRHFPALDGLRAVAVMIVIVGHHGYPIAGVPADLGVSAFFVLSGFLITRLLMREHEASGTITLREFYARRTLRIFPAYYTFLLVSFVLDHLRGERWGTALGLSAVTYTVNYFNAIHHHPSTSIAHAWSLGVEEQFYLLWPLGFLLLARRGSRALVEGVALAALAAVAWRAWLMLHGADVAYLYN